MIFGIDLIWLPRQLFLTLYLNDIHDTLWLDIIRLPQGKLRTYALFKREFSLENYAVLLSKPLRSAFCKLRISAYTLMIERGRYFSPKLPVEKRICKFCDSGFIEDEFHFIMVCKLYTCHRVILFSSLSDIANLNMFDENHIFKYTMRATDYDILFVVASFVKDAFEERSKYINGSQLAKMKKSY